MKNLFNQNLKKKQERISENILFFISSDLSQQKNAKGKESTYLNGMEFYLLHLRYDSIHSVIYIFKMMNSQTFFPTCNTRESRYTRKNEPRHGQDPKHIMNNQTPQSSDSQPGRRVTLGYRELVPEVPLINTIPCSLY